MRFQLLLDRVLEDGRFGVINSSADGCSGPDHTARVLKGALDIPLGTVKSRLHYATRGLRAALEADERAATPARSEHPA